MAGIALLAVSGAWWLLRSARCAWPARGSTPAGSSPYGYRGLGEIAVFLFFGPVAVLGTSTPRAGGRAGSAIGASVGVGLLACAVLVANNLRDVAVRHRRGQADARGGARRARHPRLYAALVVIPLG